MIATRRSVGRVRNEPVDDVVVRDLLTAATAAPTHHMREPWRFVVLTGAARRTVGAAHAVAYRRAHPDADASVLAREADRLLRAPVVIAVAARLADGDAVARREDRDAVAAAVQNLLLAAHAHGLGAIWRTGTMPDEPEVHAALGLLPSDELVAMVYLGVPDMTPPERPRTPVDDVTIWRRA